MIQLENYPKSTKKLLEFTKDVLRQFQKEMLQKIPLDEGEVVPEIDDKIALETANYLLKQNIRVLYNFFDQEEIYMIPDRKEGKWAWKIGTGVMQISDDTFKSREEAEVVGFKEAFIKLEEK